ncbi:hypothetical protein T09_7050 [Trichinella sp. T9]|nr:hypothetical protein T09_7050 [Trichinella sp. T9]
MNAAALPTFSFLFDLEPQPRAAHTQEISGQAWCEGSSEGKQVQAGR